MRHLLILSILLSCLIILWTGCEKEEAKVCSFSFIDERDGTEYCMITIGTQTWMAENLRYNSDTFYYNVLNPTSVNKNYGNLYTFSQANQVCPNGWHLPSDEEWKTLEMALGMSLTVANGLNERGTNQGMQLKSMNDWDSTFAVSLGTNSSGFNALPAGSWNPSYGPFFELGSTANYWTATAYDNTAAWVRSLYYNESGVQRNYASQKFGYSCRCIKD